MMLYRGLERVHGLKPWIDKESLFPGQNWRIAIGNAIRDSRFFVALLSSNSVNKKGFVQRELKVALAISINQGMLAPDPIDFVRVSTHYPPNIDLK